MHEVSEPRRIPSEYDGIVLFAYGRMWTVTSTYAPIKQLRIAGMRMRLQDQKGFITFCNQRDFEVLAGVGSPDAWCRWLGDRYVEQGSTQWFGFCWESFDHEDDLAEWSVLLASEGKLVENVDIERKIFDDGVDWIERSYFNGEAWIRVEREKENWEACSYLLGSRLENYCLMTPISLARALLRTNAP